MADEFTDHTRAELELLAKNEAGNDTLENIDRHIRVTLVKIDHDAAHIRAMEIALIEAAMKFREYAEHHRAKNPPDDEKARVNDLMSGICHKARYGDFVAPELDYLSIIVSAQAFLYSDPPEVGMAKDVLAEAVTWTEVDESAP